MTDVQSGPDEPVGVRRRTLFVFVWVLLIFHLSGYVGDDMATTTMSVAMAVVEQGTVVLDDYVEGARELAWRDGHFYSGMPPGQSFIAIPFYAVLRPGISVAAAVMAPRLRAIPAAAEYDLHRDHAVRRLILLVLFQVLLVAPCAAAVCVMTVDLAGRLRLPHGRLAPLLLPLATIWWTYGAGSGPRIMGGFLLLLPIWWLLVRLGDATPRRSLVMAVVMGGGLVLAPLARYELVFPAVLIAVWALARLARAQALALAVAMLVMSAVGLAYHARCYGSPTSTSYSKKIYTASRLERETGHSPDGLPRLEYGGTTYVVYNQHDLLGFTPGTIADGIWRDREALLRFSPWIVLVPWGLWLLLRGGGAARGPALLLTGLLIVNLIVLAMMPHAGVRGTVGPRYLLWSMPLCVLLALPAWALVPRLLRWALFSASFAPCYLAAMFTSRARSAWAFDLVGRYGLTNYTFSRLQEAEAVITPAIATVVTLAFWAVMVVLFLRAGSRWSVHRRPDVAEGEIRCSEGG